MSAFQLIPLPVTKCQSWLRCLADLPSCANSDNSSSEKSFWTFPYQTTALSFTYFVLMSLLNLCPRPDSDELCLMTFPGHHRKPTTEHLPLGYTFSHSRIYHDDTCARKAQYPPKRCENHRSIFPLCFLTFLI